MSIFLLAYIDVMLCYGGNSICPYFYWLTLMLCYVMVVIPYVHIFILRYEACYINFTSYFICSQSLMTLIT